MAARIGVIITQLISDSDDSDDGIVVFCVGVGVTDGGVGEFAATVKDPERPLISTRSMIWDRPSATN